MKKTKLAFTVAMLFFAVAANSANAQGYYVEASAGVTNQDSLDWGYGSYDMDQGWNAAVTIGKSVWTDWDAALQLSYDKMEYSCCNPNNTHEYRLMANLTRNFNTGSAWTPYLGGGLGFAKVTYHNQSGWEEDDTVAAYQVIAGVRYAVNGTWGLFGEYRYQDNFSNPKSNGLEWEQNGHNFALGVRYNLN